MASSAYPSISIVVVFVVVLMIPSIGLCEDTGQGCEMQQEVTSLLPCTTFVQGTTPEPTESCCDNLGDIYRQQPQCLCSFLNTSSVFNSLLPNINRTLLLNLPVVCNLITDDPASACKMVSFREAKKNKTTSGGGAVKNNNNATVAASPMVQVAPNIVPPAFMLHSSHTPNLLLFTTTNFLLPPLLLLCFQL